MTSILNIVLPAFVVILIGFLIGKRRKTANMSVLVDIAFDISGPAITFVSMLDRKIVLLDAGKIWASALLIMFGCGIVAWIVFKFLRQKHSARCYSAGQFWRCPSHGKNARSLSPHRSARPHPRSWIRVQRNPFLSNISILV